jgi:hypothetical protein
MTGIWVLALAIKKENQSEKFPSAFGLVTQALLIAGA